MKSIIGIITLGLFLCYGVSCKTIDADAIIADLDYKRDYQPPISIPFSKPDDQRKYLKGHKAGWLDVARHSHSKYSTNDWRRTGSSHTIVDWMPGTWNKPYPMGFDKGQRDGIEKFSELDNVAQEKYYSRMKQE